MTSLLRCITPHQLAPGRRDPVDRDTLVAAATIVDDVRARGEAALMEHAVRLGDRAPGEALVLERAQLRRALDALPLEDRVTLERTAQRIQDFAQAQRASIQALDTAIAGGRAGHTIAPVDRAGCYAPGGRFPLPSSVLMTAVTARAAGVGEVWVASPRPALVTLAAAAVANVDAVLAAGGAQAIAALAFGAGPVPAVDVVVGPGNKWVTAAKQLVAGRVGIDMLAGPSELLVLADDSANPATVAADLIAQAEHDFDAVPVLVTTDATLPARVDEELVKQLSSLPTRATAQVSLGNGFAVICSTLDEAVRVCDQVAPEHLEVLTRDAAGVGARLKHYGALFVGTGSAEVLGDYGAGPNHVLPTGSSARFAGGLSVFHFLRIRTWMTLHDPSHNHLLEDAIRLARLEGLEGHARSAEQRLPRR